MPNNQSEKQIKCRFCNRNMPFYVLKCPFCGKHTKRFFAVTVLMSIAVICITAICIISFNADILTPPDSERNINTNTQENITDKPQQTILYSDSCFDIEYMKLYDIPNNDYVTCSYIQLKVTNKSSQTITLSLDNVYVNDIVVQSGTAMPIELEPGKISTTPFILFSGNTGLTAGDITKVEFKLTARDDNFNLVHTTNKITVTK